MRKCDGPADGENYGRTEGVREEANHKKKDSKKIHFNANFKVTPSLILALIV